MRRESDLYALVECRSSELVPPSFAELHGGEHRQEEDNRDQGVCQARILEADILSESNDPEADSERHELPSQRE